MRLRKIAFIALVCATVSLSLQLQAQAGAAAPAETNLLSWGAGALVVQAPVSYSNSGDWSADALLDELPTTGWATKSGDLTPKVFVMEMAGKSTLPSLAFDTAHAENPGRAAKDLKVEISDHADGPFASVASFSLAQAKDHQKFPLTKPVTGRYL